MSMENHPAKANSPSPHLCIQTGSTRTLTISAYKLGHTRTRIHPMALFPEANDKGKHEALGDGAFINH